MASFQSVSSHEWILLICSTALTRKTRLHTLRLWDLNQADSIITRASAADKTWANCKLHKFGKFPIWSISSFKNRIYSNGSGFGQSWRCSGYCLSLTQESKFESLRSEKILSFWPNSECEKGIEKWYKPMMKAGLESDDFGTRFCYHYGICIRHNSKAR